MLVHAQHPVLLIAPLGTGFQDPLPGRGVGVQLDAGATHLKLVPLRHFTVSTQIERSYSVSRTTYRMHTGSIFRGRLANTAFHEHIILKRLIR